MYRYRVYLVLGFGLILMTGLMLQKLLGSSFAGDVDDWDFEELS
jgi:hypothetical protein